MKKKAGRVNQHPDNPYSVKIQERDSAGENENAPVPEPETVPDDERRKRRRRRIRALRSFLLRTVSLALVVYILMFHIVGLTVMPDTNMSPRLDAGDLLLFYRIDRTPKARDIVVIDKTVGSAGEPPVRFVCRVVACPGDTVNIPETGGLTVNGNAITEDYIYARTLPYAGFVNYPLTLGEGEYFVLSDSRNSGVDSRFFGTVRQEEIRGIVITILRRNNL